MNELFIRAREASRQLRLISDDQINAALRHLSDITGQRADALLRANAEDLAQADPADPKYDRLKLTVPRLNDIASSLRDVAGMKSPLGRILSHTVRPNGLDVERISVPFGVIGIIYEARPNVSFDVSALCLKSGNACLLKGSAGAWHSNKAIADLIRIALRDTGIPEDAVILMPPDHEVTDEMMKACGYVDLIIPRGGRKLIDYVRNNSIVPYIETGAGTCHIYFDIDGDVRKGAPVILNASSTASASPTRSALSARAWPAIMSGYMPMRRPTRLSRVTIPPSCSCTPMRATMAGNISTMRSR